MEAGPSQKPKPIQQKKMSQKPSAAELRKQPVPKASERRQKPERHERNAIKDNMMKVIFDNAAAQKVRLADQKRKESQEQMQ